MAGIRNAHINGCPPNDGYSIPYNSEGRLCLPNGGVLWKFCSVKRNDSSLPPNSRFAEGSYDWSVMSSIVGPSLDSVLPMTILPMDVIMVSRYTSPVMSSFTTWFELTLERPGFNTIPMDIVPTGISQSTSTSSGVLKQATTPAKPQGGVGSFTNASVLAGRGDFGGNGAFGGLDDGLMEIVLVDWRALFFILGIAAGWGISPVATTGSGWVYHRVPSGIPWSHLWYRWCLWGVSGARGISSGGSWSQRDCSFPPRGGLFPRKLLCLWRKR